MPFAALDIHLKSVEAVLLDDAGALHWRGQFPATRAALLAFARRHRVALEATFHSWAIAELPQPFVAEVVVSNPLRTRAIAEAKIKTDRVDATVPAHLLRRITCRACGSPTPIPATCGTWPSWSGRSPCSARRCAARPTKIRG